MNPLLLHCLNLVIVSMTLPLVSKHPSALTMWLRIIAFAIPLIGSTLLLSPVIAVLGGIYAKYYGLSLTSIAGVILAAKLFDAVTDPLIGYYSDRWRLKIGSRKPLILVGVLLVRKSLSFRIFTK